MGSEQSEELPVAIALVCMLVVLAVLIQPIGKEPDLGDEAGDIIILPEPQNSVVSHKP